MMVKGGTLSEILFIPEPFRAAEKTAIEQRRTAALLPALPPKSGPRKLMILVGEIKDFAPTRNGHRVVVKHMPDFPFLLDEGLHRRLKSRFENELALWGADDSSHLITIAAFGLSPAGLAVAEDMAIMVVAENWVPYDSVYEKKLVDALAKVSERSVKSLRYNLSPDKPTAAAMLQHQSEPIALYGIVEMCTERVDGDGLAGQVLDGVDRAAVQDIEGAVHGLVDAVRRIGGDERIAVGDRVDDGRRRRGAYVNAARGERKQGFRTALRIADVLERDAGTLEVAELDGKLMGCDAAAIGHVAKGDGVLCGSLLEEKGRGDSRDGDGGKRFQHGNILECGGVT